MSNVNATTSSPDVLVIGAGLTGALIASQLAEHGARVGLIDGLRVGQGATVHALGIATPDPTDTHFEETTRGVARLRNIADRHAIKLQSCNVLHTATTTDGAAALKRLAGSQLATRAEWTTQPGVLPRGIEAGLLIHDGALVDLDRMLTRLLHHPRISVVQNTEVLQLEQRGASTYAICRDSTLAAACVVLATNAYAGLLSPYLADSVRVVRGTAFTSHPLPDIMASQFGMPVIVNIGKLAISPMPGGRVQAVAFQTDGGSEGGNGSDTYDSLRRFLRQIDPNLPSQASAWASCVTTFTGDGSPLVGRLVGPALSPATQVAGATNGTVLYALGLGAFGLAWGAIVADKIAAMALSPVQ